MSRTGGVTVAGGAADAADIATILASVPFSIRLCGRDAIARDVRVVVGVREVRVVPMIGAFLWLLSQFGVPMAHQCALACWG